MSDFRDLSLRRENIDGAIKSLSNTHVSHIKQNSKIHHTYTVQSEGQEAKLEFYFKNDGTTTISAQSGKGGPLFYKIAHTF